MIIQPRTIWRVCAVSALLAVAGLAQAEGRWLVPTNGWDHNYVAIDGSGAGSGVPTDFNSLWKGSYQSANPEDLDYVAIISDPVEGDVLMLIHTNSSPYYSMRSAPGAGTTNDLITLDCRFRLADDSQDDEEYQLFLSVVRPQLDGSPTGWNQWIFYCGKQRLRVNSSVIPNVPLDLDWHTLRLVADVALNIGWVYLDNNPLPIYTGPSEIYKHASTRNWVGFGDSGGVINGKANIKYLRWTTSELVHPAPYRHSGDTDPLTEGFTLKPQNLEYAASNNLLPQDTSPSWRMSSFGPGTTMTNDDITGEAALHLVMTNANYEYGNYNFQEEQGQFTPNDLVEVECRFRLLDDSQADDQDQFQVMLLAPRPDGIGGEQLWQLRFARDHINYFNNSSSLKKYPTTISTNWHNVRWRVDMNTRTAEVYLDDNPVSSFSHKSRIVLTATNNYTTFGDGSSGVTGIARLSYLRVTRQTPSWQGGAEPDTTPYWQGVDGDGSYGYYEVKLPANVLNHTEGWTASCKLRLPHTSEDAYSVMRCHDSMNIWGLIFQRDAYYCQQADGSLLQLSSNSRPEQYSTYQIYYDPIADSGNGAVSYYKDGWLAQSVTRANAYTNELSKKLFQWGCDNVPSATSTQRWNLVEFEFGNRVIAPIPRDGTIIFIQ